MRHKKVIIAFFIAILTMFGATDFFWLRVLGVDNTQNYYKNVGLFVIALCEFGILLLPYYLSAFLLARASFSPDFPKIADMVRMLRQQACNDSGGRSLDSIFSTKTMQRIYVLVSLLAMAAMAAFPNKFLSQGFGRFVPLLGVYGYSVLKRTVFENRLKKHSPRCLYLRTFSTDLVSQYTWYERNKVAKWARLLDGVSGGIRYASSLTGGVEFRFNSILEEFAGPAVAVGRPGELISIPGVHRLYFEDGEWQSNVLNLMLSCKLVVIAVGSTPGIQWEIEQIRLNNLFAKTIWLFLPEYASEAHDSRILSLAKIFPQVVPLLDSHDGDTEVACVCCSKDGRVIQVNIERLDRFSYREAVIIGLYENLIDRSEIVSIQAI